MNDKTYPHFYKLKKDHRPNYNNVAADDRPPTDTIGLYFEQIERFGEDAMINWDVEGQNYLFTMPVMMEPVALIKY